MGFMKDRELKRTLVHVVRGAGRLLLRYLGKVRRVRQKGHISSVVCEADLASEEYVIKRLRTALPEAKVISEESGWIEGTSEFTWVIDPLDGTSNFVAGLPWFGVQAGLLRNGKPVLAAMYLPVEDTLYVSELGGGVQRNGRPVQVTSEPSLKKVLCAFGFDAAAGQAETRRHADLLMRVAGGVRNTRATNSLVDFCYCVDGRLGGCINLKCMVWDIVPVSLMLPEAGGILTDLKGNTLEFDLDRTGFEKTYTVLGASRKLHPRLVARTKP
jgi:myo-inositol-1(or 4)-monophosphatase